MTANLQKSILYSFLMAICAFSSAQELQLDSAAIYAMPNDTAKVKAWLKLSESTLKSSFKRGKGFAQEALSLANELKFDRGINGAKMQLGRCESYMGNFAASFAWYKEAYAFYKQTGNRKKQAHALNRMGETKRNLDEFEEALGYMQAALELNGELGDTNEIGSCYISIGILHAIQGNQKEAEPYFLKAIESFKAVGNEGRTYLTIINLASLYNEMEDYDNAIKFGSEAKAYLEENGPEFRLGVCLFNLATSYDRKNELENARSYFLEALEIFERLGDSYRVNGSIIGLSRIDLKLGKTDAALVGALEGLKGAKEIGSRNLEYKAYDHISNVYVARKNFEKALEYRLLYQALVDSINNSESKERIAEIEEKYQSELKERQLAEAKADLELQELHLRRQQVQNRILVGVVVAGIIIFLLLLNLFRTKQKTNKVLAEKNALIEQSLGEKEVLLKEIHHRVKNNLQFISSLFNLQARHVTDEKALEILQEGKNRIQSMALVHQKLYQEENLTGVNMRDYLNSLLSSLQHSYKEKSSAVVVQANLEALKLDIDAAMPIGLIVNELVTNAFKYAFSNQQKGTINVSLTNSNDCILLNVSDNGDGLPADFDTENPKKFGLRLVNSLAEKLGSKPVLKSENGLSISVSISNAKVAGV